MPNIAGKLIAATALAAALTLPALFGASDASAREQVNIRVGPFEASVSTARRSPPPARPHGRWEWQTVVTREPDRVERVRVEVCKPRGRSHRERCDVRWENRVVRGAEHTTGQWVWVASPRPAPRHYARR